jgi:hypothetical protein
MSVLILKFVVRALCVLECDRVGAVRTLVFFIQHVPSLKLYLISELAWYMGGYYETWFGKAMKGSHGSHESHLATARWRK